MIRFCYTGLSKEQGDYLWELEHKFDALERRIQFSASCIEMLDHARSLPGDFVVSRGSNFRDDLLDDAERSYNRSTDWAIIAARMFAISLYEIDYHRERIIQSINEQPFLVEKLDRDAEKRARELFRQIVGGDISQFRFWAAHGDEGYKKDKDSAKIRRPLNQAVRNEFIGAGPGTISMGLGLAGNNLTMTIDGELLSLEVSWRTFDLILEWSATFKSSLCYFIDTRLGSVNPS